MLLVDRSRLKERHDRNARAYSIFFDALLLAVALRLRAR